MAGRTRLVTVALATALGLVLGAVAGASAASPLPDTLGSRVAPGVLDVTADSELMVQNLSGSGIALDYVVTAPDGYVVEPVTFTLAANARQTVTVTTVGKGDGVITVVAVPSPGQLGGTTVTSGLSLGVKVIHGGPALGLPILLVVIVAAVLGALGALWRRRGGHRSVLAGA